MTQYKDGKVIHLPARNQYVGAFSIMLDGKLHSNVLLGIPQHLYVITDDSFQKYDWIICLLEGVNFNKIVQTIQPIAFKGWSKIVATTDPSLKLPGIQSSWLRDVYIPSQGKITDIKMEMERSHKIITDREEFYGRTGFDMQLKLINNEVVIIPEDKVTCVKPEDLGGRSAQAILRPSSGIEPQYQSTFNRAKIEEQAIEAAADNYAYSPYRESFKAGISWYKEYLKGRTLGAKAPDS